MGPLRHGEEMDHGGARDPMPAAPGSEAWGAPDRYFTLRFSVDGRQIEEALGWASDGWNLERAQEELGKLRAAKRTGVGPATLRGECRSRAAG